MAKEIGIPVEKVVQVLKVATLPRSLDAPANSGETKRSKNLEEDSVSLVDSIAWHAEEPVMQMAKEQLIKEDINALVSAPLVPSPSAS